MTATSAPFVEAEPNDDFYQANAGIGPEGLTGVIETGSDADFFALRLRPQRQVRMFFDLGPACLGPTGLDVALDSDDRQIDIGSLLHYFPGGLAITTPGLAGGPSVAAVLTVNLRDTRSTGCTYTFRVTNLAGGPTDALDPSLAPPLPTVAVGEPNDVDAQATGPLVADTLYTGTIDTNQDVDYLWVPFLAGADVATEFSLAGGELFVSIPSLRGGWHVEYHSLGLQGVARRGFRVTQSGRHLIRLTGLAGTRWRLRVSPASAIGTESSTGTSAPTGTSKETIRGRLAGGDYVTLKGENFWSFFVEGYKNTHPCGGRPEVLTSRWAAFGDAFICVFTGKVFFDNDETAKAQAVCIVNVGANVIPLGKLKALGTLGKRLARFGQDGRSAATGLRAGRLSTAELRLINQIDGARTVATLVAKGDWLGALNRILQSRSAALKLQKLLRTNGSRIAAQRLKAVQTSSSGILAVLSGIEDLAACRKAFSH